MKVEEILSNLEAKHPGEKEYLQAVKEGEQSWLNTAISRFRQRKPC